MTAPVFAPGRLPVLGGHGSSYSARVRRVEFEGGYAQRSRSGPNTVGRTLSLTWRGLPRSVSDPILAFFDARGGAEAFAYAPPGESVALLWTCAEWTASETADDAVELTATFVQEFDL